MAVGWVTYIWNLRCSNLVAGEEIIGRLFGCVNQKVKGLVLFRQCSLSSSPYLLANRQRDDRFPPIHHDRSFRSFTVSIHGPSEDRDTADNCKLQIDFGMKEG
jgi:hypothetical protein